MDRSDVKQFREFVVQLSGQVIALREYCRKEGIAPGASHFKTEFCVYLADVSRTATQFGFTVEAAVGRVSSPTTYPTMGDICSLVLESGLDTAVLFLLQALLPLLQTCSNNTGTPGTPGATAAAAASAALRSAAEQRQSGSNAAVIGWEWSSETQGCLSIALILLAAIHQTICYAGPIRPAHKLSLQLLHDGFLLRVLDAASHRALMHLLFTKIMGHRPAHVLIDYLFQDVSTACLRTIHLIISLPAGDQLQALHALPPRFLDTVCRLHAHAHNPTLPETQANFVAIAMLATSDPSNSLTTALHHAQQHDSALAAALTAALSSPSMQRITHASLVQLIPRTAVGRVTPCAGNLSDHGLSPSTQRLKQHNLLSIRLLLESMLRRLDDDHARQRLADSGHSIIHVRLGWSDASTTPSNPHTPAACDTFGRIWGCGSKPEEKMLLSPKAIKLSTLIFEIVRIGMWDTPAWGSLCCRLVGALLRACDSDSCNSRMRSELGRAMAAVARLATAAALNVLQQSGPEKDGEADLREGKSFFKSFGSHFMPSLNKQQTPFNHVVGMGSHTAGALRVLVTQMLRVGKFCNEADWRVTGVCFAAR